MGTVSQSNYLAPVASAPSPLDTPQQVNRFSFALLTAALLIGIALQFFGPAWTQTILSAATIDSFANIAALFLALCTAVVLHESGHLAAALLMRFQVLSVCVGPLRATRSYGKWSVHPSRGLFTGSISAIPRNTHRWRERVLFVIAGGPLATLVTGIAAGLLFFYAAPSGWPKTFLAALTELSGFLFVLGFIPNGRTAPVRNDATLFSIVWRETAEARDILLYHLIARLEVDGVRPGDYPAGLIRAIAAAQGRPDAMLVYAQLIVLWALDTDDLANALAWDERALALSKHCNLAAQQATLARSACVDVLFRDDWTAARTKFAQVELDSLAPAWFRHRAKAASYLIDARIPETLSEICSAQYAFPSRSPYYEFEHALLTRLHRQALSSQPAELCSHDHTRAA